MTTTIGEQVVWRPGGCESATLWANEGPGRLRPSAGRWACTRRPRRPWHRQSLAWRGGQPS
eukprot:2270496-Alexandrium_andersonii.AAC.1